VHVARIRDMRKYTQDFVCTLGLDGRTMLKWISKKEDSSRWTWFTSLRIW
jgi:hypothetical protein